MTIATDFGYVQARIQARLPELMSETQWQRLAAVRTLSAYLEEARATALRPRIMGFSAVSGAHEIERGLRTQWRHAVAEVAGWAPAAWRPAVAWTVWIPDLPLLREGLAASLPSWAAADERWSAWLDDDGKLDLPALRRSGAQPLLAGGLDRLARCWLERWAALWPRTSGPWRKALEGSTAVVKGVWMRREQAVTALAGDADRGERLRRLLRRRLKQPATLFVYLALVALELERLLGALSQRAVFGEREETG